MDKEFKKKSDAVFQVLRTIAKAEPSVVFLGGSAIQAILKEPKRLSIDLDLSFYSDPQRIADAVQSVDFTVSKRPSRNPLFTFYKASKSTVEIKLDICHFKVNPTERLSIRGVDVSIPAKNYLLASKLSSLALGTIGRLAREPVQIIKDIFDINCLLNESVLLSGMDKAWSDIISDQNRLRGTMFKESAVFNSVQSTLLSCLSLASTPTMPLNALSTFEDYLVSGRLSRQEFIMQSARALMLLTHMDNKFYFLDSSVNKDYSHKLKMVQAESELLEAKILAPIQLHELKVVVPKALLYLLYWSRKK